MLMQLCLIVFFLGTKVNTANGSILIAGILVQESSDTTVSIENLQYFSERAWKNHYSDSAQVYYEEVIDMAKKLGDKNIEAQNLNRLGIFYRNLDLQEEALKYYDEALKTSRSIQNKKEEGFALNNIAQIYHYQNLHEESIDFYTEAQTIFQEINFMEGLGYTYTGLSAAYSEIKNYLLAIELINKAIQIRMDLDHERQVTISKLNRGDIYYQLGNLEAAEADIRTFLDYALVHDQRGAVSTYGKLGEVYFKGNQDEKAIEMAQKAIELNVSHPNSTGMVTVYGLLYQIFLKKNQPEKAMQYLELLSEAKNAIDEEKTKNYLSALMIQKQKDEIEALNRENLLKDKNDNFKLWISYILTILVVVLFAAFFVYYRSFQKEKDNLNKLLEQKIRIQKQAEELDKLNLVKDKIFSILAHDLRGPLHSLQGMIELMNQNDLTQDEFKSFLPLLSQNLGNNTILLENLLTWSKSQMKGMEANFKTFNLFLVIENNFSFFQKSNYFKGQKLFNKVPDPLMVKADKAMLEVVLRNLISNALKFTSKDDEIKISCLLRSDGTYTISVEDSGVGIKEENLNKLFGKEFISTSGTHQESGTGIGLLLSKELIEKNRGIIWAESKLGLGSTFKFTISKS
ncbi:ATP-binding protein [Rhodonellum sp.]|uniref:tetratricopeptide repeat-containing sensor histidine kinase n=1 Tax=Rhodonellum sp. TaxID=2231180 RepID=UPI002728488B|nr:ATP-binding protein [Rhodonellum sp.]MDO9552853.1 tetratricopeptide repeat protein [Rhodonellum sp.]